jgi:hypothetical protein
MRLERDIEAQFLKYLGGFVLPLKLNLQGNRGWPDRLIILPNGRVCWVELKRPGGVVAKLQCARHRALKEMGHAVGVFDNALEAAYFVAYAWRSAVGSTRLPKGRRAVAARASRSSAVPRPRSRKDFDLPDRIRCVEARRKGATHARGRATAPGGARLDTKPRR